MNEVLLEKLLDISRKLSENRWLDPLLEYAISIALDLFQAEHGYLVLLDQDGQLDFRVYQDRWGQRLDEPEEQISHTIFEQVVTSGEGLILANAQAASDFQDAESVIALRLRSVMCVPLISRGRTIGAIYLENRSESAIFTEDALKPLEYFAAQAAVSIENAILNGALEARVAERTAELMRANQLLREEIEERRRIEEELKRLATIDPLTGVYNRRHFLTLARQEFARSLRHGHQISLILFDVDLLKTTNDTYGHLVGDKILQATAQRFMRNLRQMDILARYGGDEFVILLPETTPEQAEAAARRLHAVVTAEPVATIRGAIPLRLSMGVACMDGVEDMEKLLLRADQALYIAKDLGRNQVIVFNDGHCDKSKASDG